MTEQQRAPKREEVVAAFDLAARSAKRTHDSTRRNDDPVKRDRDYNAPERDYNAAISKLCAYLMVRAEFEISRMKKVGACLDYDDAGDAVEQTVAKVDKRHATGVFVRPEHIVRFAEDVLLKRRMNEKTKPIPSLLNKSERKKKGRLRKEVSFDVSNGPDDDAAGVIQIPVNDVQPDTRLHAKNAILQWEAALQAEATSKRMEKQPAKRQMLMDLLAFLRHNLTEAGQASAHFYEQCKLYKRSKRGFEMNRHATEFFLIRLPVDDASPAQRQNRLNRRLDRVVPLLDQMRLDQCHKVDLFGIAEKAGELRARWPSRRKSAKKKR